MFGVRRCSFVACSNVASPATSAWSVVSRGVFVCRASGRRLGYFQVITSLLIIGRGGGGGGSGGPTLLTNIGMPICGTPAECLGHDPGSKF